MRPTRLRKRAERISSLRPPHPEGLLQQECQVRERETDGPPVEEENPAQHPLILDSVDESESDGAGGDEEESSTNPDLPVAAEPPPRRSTREKRSVDYYGLPQAHLTIHREPTTFDEATACPEKAKWKEAMGKEMKSLEENKVHCLLERRLLVPNGCTR